MTEARGKDILVIAGGIGLAPLRPAIYHILRHRGDYRRLIVLYGARSPRDMLYRKQLAAWTYLPDTQILTTVDYGGLSWRGYVGVVTTLFRLRASAAQPDGGAPVRPRNHDALRGAGTGEPRESARRTSTCRWSAT